MNLIQKRNPENDEILSYQCRWYCEASRPTFESSMSMNFNYLLDNLTISSVSKKDRQSSVMIKIFIFILIVSQHYSLLKIKNASAVCVCKKKLKYEHTFFNNKLG